MLARPVVEVRRSWVAWALVVFTVAIWPLCWSGSMTRRAHENLWLGLPMLQQQGSNNNEEEHEQHKKSVAREESRWSTKPPPVVIVARPERVRVAHVPVLLRSAQVPNPHPSEFSTRLLI